MVTGESRHQGKQGHRNATMCMLRQPLFRTVRKHLIQKEQIQADPFTKLLRHGVISSSKPGSAPPPYA
jgi:hypothetical protein